MLSDEVLTDRKLNICYNIGYLHITINYLRITILYYSHKDLRNDMYVEYCCPHYTSVPRLSANSPPNPCTNVHLYQCTRQSQFGLILYITPDVQTPDTPISASSPRSFYIRQACSTAKDR